MLPPVLAGLLTGVIRAATLIRCEDPATLDDWRRWFVTYDRVPLNTIAITFLLIACAFFPSVSVANYANVWTELSFAVVVSVIFGVTVGAVLLALIGAMVGIPIAAVVCVLIHDGWLWIDDGD